jgi:2-amino-4-hydroxy-6-hydroxymethyldihydropteridine diphosphokinase
VERAYVGVGSNLGDRAATIRRALDVLDARQDLDVVGLSTLLETEPWGYVDQATFLNGVVAVDTSLRPRALLDALLEVERELGRTREGPRYGPRTIDLDLLLYGELEIDEPGLTVPHPRLHERAFALEPLYELDSGLAVPGRGSVADLLAALHSDP